MGLCSVWARVETGAVPVSGFVLERGLVVEGGLVLGRGLLVSPDAGGITGCFLVSPVAGRGCGLSVGRLFGLLPSSLFFRAGRGPVLVGLAVAATMPKGADPTKAAPVRVVVMAGAPGSAALTCPLAAVLLFWRGTLTLRCRSRRWRGAGGAWRRGAWRREVFQP